MGCCTFISCSSLYSLNITNLHTAVLAVDCFFQIVNILNQDQVPAHIDHAAFSEFSKHPIETLTC